MDMLDELEFEDIIERVEYAADDDVEFDIYGGDRDYADIEGIDWDSILTDAKEFDEISGKLCCYY